MDDFISKTLTENAVKNGNNVIYVLGEGWNSDSVGLKLKFLHLLKRHGLDKILILL